MARIGLPGLARFLGLAALVLGQFLLLFLLGLLLLQLLLLGQLFFALFLFALGLFPLGLLLGQLAFLLLLFQALAAFLVLLVLLQFLLALFLQLFLALLLLLQGDVGVACVGLGLAWGRRRWRRWCGRGLWLGRGFGGRRRGGRSARGAACCGTAAQSSASTAGWSLLLFQFTPQVSATTSTAWASTARVMARMRPGGRGGANWSRS